MEPRARASMQGMQQADGAARPPKAQGQQHVFKVVLLGSSSVGKTSLALRYVKNDFKSVLPTVGCAFFTKVVDVSTVPVKLEIWDTAGQEKYHSVCHLYFRGAHAALLVYDIACRDSFHQAQRWLEDLEKEFRPGEVVVALVGNKTDLSLQREVAAQEGQALADNKGLLFSESSAKLNQQVAEIFNAVARELLQRASDREVQTHQGQQAGVVLNERSGRQAGCCAH